MKSWLGVGRGGKTMTTTTTKNGSLGLLKIDAMCNARCAMER